jgi:transposase-like protein
VFAGFRFPAEVIVEELLVERRIEVDHVTVFRWVQRFTPAARGCRPVLPTRAR